MKYICIGYHDKALNSRPKAEIEAMMKQCEPLMKEFYNSGHVIVDAGLTLGTTSVRTMKGKVVVTDGPYVETKEQLGSVFIIEAADLNEAVQLASRHPAVVLGDQFGSGVEIRALHTFNQP